MIKQLLGAGLGKAVDDVLGRFFQDKDKAAEAAQELKDKAAEAAQELRLAMMEHEQTAQQVARDVVVAEAKSEHWITSAWRPITMLVFVAIVANNFIIAPYVDMFFDAGLHLTIPDKMWGLLQIGLAGYVGGRSAEKVMKEYKKKKGD